MTRQRLSSKEKRKILTLSASGKSMSTVAKQVGRNRQTVGKFLNGPAVKELLADKFESLCRKVLESISDEDITKSSLLQKTTSAAIMVDKTQLLRGNPTSINVSLMLDAVETIREMRKLEERPLVEAGQGELTHA